QTETASPAPASSGATAPSQTARQDHQRRPRTGDRGPSAEYRVPTGAVGTLPSPAPSVRLASSVLGTRYALLIIRSLVLGVRSSVRGPRSSLARARRAGRSRGSDGRSN